jgi:hypothetical protein
MFKFPYARNYARQGPKKTAKIKGSLVISVANAQNIAQKEEDPVRWQLLGPRPR